MSDDFSLERLRAETTAALAPDSPKRPVLEFLSPTELRAYEPPPGSVLAGDFHIARGSVFIIGGAPGVGKSRAGVALAVAGATAQPWFGLSVPTRFRTMIIQNENGKRRLKDELLELEAGVLDPWIRISPPPPLGMNFRDREFRTMLMAAIETFKPDLILIDPWNAVATDDKARDYLETFELIRSIIPADENGPAVGIIAHTRKPKHEERTSGRSLLNMLAGSYVLASIPRSVFVIQPASDETSDDRIVFTCCKNNDGPLGKQTAWVRGNGLFLPAPDFDWSDFHGSNSQRKAVSAEDMAQLLGGEGLPRQEAVMALTELTGCCKSSAYAALDLDGRFKAHLAQSGVRLVWHP